MSATHFIIHSRKSDAYLPSILIDGLLPSRRCPPNESSRRGQTRCTSPSNALRMVTPVHTGKRSVSAIENLRDGGEDASPPDGRQLWLSTYLLAGGGFLPHLSRISFLQDVGFRSRGHANTKSIHNNNPGVSQTVR